MGGLVARAYLRRYGGAKVRSLITIGSPHHGSVHAWLFPGTSLAEMRPGNPWIEALNRGAAPTVPVLSIWSWHDSMVAPQTSCKLKDAQNIALTGVGHNAILADAGAFARAAALIAAEQARAEKPADDAAEPSLTSEFPASVARTPSARA
jgi:pimeloyl-ACP methyl ester carboxylesterase